jgi:serine/threonine protein phosphatase PrpC
LQKKCCHAIILVFLLSYFILKFCLTNFSIALFFVIFLPLIYDHKSLEIPFHYVQNINGRADTVFCGVFDGHGPHGHIVARKVRDTLPSKLRDLLYDDYGESPISNSDGSILEETLSPNADAEDKSPLSRQKQEHREFFCSMKDSFRKAFRVTDKELKLHRNIDSICSGSTAVTLIKQVAAFL